MSFPLTPDETAPHWCAALPIEALAETYGTPFYLYDLPTLRQQSRRFREAFGPEVELLFALKANPNPQLLRIMCEEALIDGVDIASPGEWALATQAGWSHQQLSYTGPGKRLSDLQRALDANIGTLCVESLRELTQLATLADSLDTQAPIMFRVNPSEEVHAFGMRISGEPVPFGIDEEALPEAISFVKEHMELFDFQGIHVHAGSQCFSAKAFARSMQQTLQQAQAIEEAGLPVSTVNFGGGFGMSNWCPYKQISLKGIASHLRAMLQQWPKHINIKIEPGRLLMGPSGVYVSRVISTKHSRGQDFCIMDGGIHHYLEATLPALTNQKAFAWVANLTRPTAPEITTQLCGCLCTTRDRIGRNVKLPQPQEGDLLAWPHAGAYGLSASPLLFLGHDTPAELLYDGENVSLIRQRHSITEWL